MSNYMTDVILSLNINPSREEQEVFEKTYVMIDIVSIIADGIDITNQKTSYDAEFSLPTKIEAKPNQRAELKLIHSKQLNVWSLFLMPFGNTLSAFVYNIPGDTHKLKITYRLLKPNHSESKEMTTVLHIR